MPHDTLQKSPHSLFPRYFPESTIKNNTLLVTEAAMERKEKLKTGACSA